MKRRGAHNELPAFFYLNRGVIFTNQMVSPDIAENVTLSPYRHLAVGHFATNGCLFFATTGEDVSTHVE